MRRRVVITGLGVITSLGETVDGYWDRLCAGRSGIKTDHPLGCQQISRFASAGNAPILTLQPYGVDVREAKRLDRFGQFGIAASIHCGQRFGD